MQPERGQDIGQGRPSVQEENSPERSLRHEGGSHFEADLLVVSSDQVSSGILVTSDLVSQGFPLQPLPPTHVLTMDTSTYG